MQLVAQRVDHRARHQRQADDVEPDQGDEDEPERPADLARCSTPARGRRGRPCSPRPMVSGDEQRPGPDAPPRHVALRARSSRSMQQIRNVTSERRGQQQQRCRGPGCREAERQVVGARGRAAPSSAGITTLAARKQRHDRAASPARSASAPPSRGTRRGRCGRRPCPWRPRTRRRSRSRRRPRRRRSRSSSRGSGRGVD